MNNKKVLGISSFCAVLSACGSGLPTSQTKDSPSTGTSGPPALQLQVDENNNGNWVDVNHQATVVMDCQSMNNSYKFRLLNNGTGNLIGTGGSVVTFNQSTNGSTFNFGVTQPSMPVAASSSGTFDINLVGSANCEHLTGANGSVYGSETALVTIGTNDPTSPSYEATIQVLGHS